MMRLRCGCSNNHKKTLKSPITECGYFIQSYPKDVSFCMYSFYFVLPFVLNYHLLGKCPTKNILSNGKIAVEGYRESLKKLGNYFVSVSIADVEINMFCIIDPTFCKWNNIFLLDLDMNLRQALAQDPTRGKAAFGQIPGCDLDLWSCGEFTHLSLAHS